METSRQSTQDVHNPKETDQRQSQTSIGRSKQTIQINYTCLNVDERKAKYITNRFGVISKE